MARAGAPAPAEPGAEVTQRLREAMLAVVCERGYRSATVQEVCCRAGASPAVFERTFGSREEAFLRIYREEVEVLLAVVEAARRPEKDWRDGLRSGAYAAAGWLRDHPREARFCILGVLTAGDAAQLQRERLLRGVAAYIDRGRRLDPGRDVSPVFAAAIVGAISEMLVRRLADGEQLADIADLVPELMFIAVRPYVDEATAMEELTLAPPPGYGPPKG